MSKKNTHHKFDWKTKNKETERERMCKIYAAYKRFSNGKVEFTRQDFIDDEFEFRNRIRREFDTNPVYDENGNADFEATKIKMENTLKEIQKRLRIQNAISNGLSQISLEMDKKIKENDIWKTSKRKMSMRH